MAQKGQTVDELFIGLGLDISQLQIDFQTANTTVSNAIKRLNQESNQIKIKSSIDTAGLQGAEQELDVLKRKEQELNDLLTRQKQILAIRDAAYKQNVAKNGEDSSSARGSLTAVLKQQAAVAKLESQLKANQSRQKELTPVDNTDHSKVGTVLSGIATASAKAKEGVDSVTGAYGSLSSKMAGMMAVATTGYGLFNITQSAMEAGDNLYKLSNRLHLTTGEASKLSKLFSVSGTNIQGVIPFFSQLDKSVLSSKNGMNSTTLALMKFGVSLKDSSGNLLPINKQLDNLAAGYKKAADAGKEEEFTAEVLGRRGAELVPLLEDYTDNLQVANSIEATGLLNPEEAHKLSLEWKVMKAEAGQLELAFGSAMIPIAREVMPEVTKGMKDLVSYIKDNKDDIKSAIEGWGAALAEVGKIAGSVAVAVGKLGKDMGSNREDEILSANIPDYASGKQKMQSGFGLTMGIGTGALTAAALGIGTGGLGFIPLAGGLAAGTVGYEFWGGREANKYRNDQIATHSKDWNQWAENYHLQQVAAGKEKYSRFEQTAADALNNNLDTSKWDKYAGAIDDTSKKLQDLTGVDIDFRKSEQDSKQATDANTEAQNKAAQAMEWRATAAGQLSEKIYSLTHNDVENATHNMWVEVEKATANGVPKDLIDKFISAQSTRISEDKFRNVTAPMAEAFKTDLQNQLDQIDIQAKSYVRAGATQEEADAWAQQRKSKINAEWDRQVASQIDSIWKDSFQNRLDEIDREAEAWKQKGLDEAKATEWAEEKKRQSYEETAQSMFSSQLKYYRAWSKGGVQGIIQQMRREMKIPANAMTSPEEIANFQAAMKSAKDNLVPIVPNDQLESARAQAAAASQPAIEVLRGAVNSLQSSLQPVINNLTGAGRTLEVQPTAYNPSVTINTNVSDTVMTNDIVDLIADRTATKVNDALQPMKNNYYDNKYGV